MLKTSELKNNITLINTSFPVGFPILPAFCRQCCDICDFRGVYFCNRMDISHAVFGLILIDHDTTQEIFATNKVKTYTFA